MGPERTSAGCSVKRPLFREKPEATYALDRMRDASSNIVNVQDRGTSGLFIQLGSNVWLTHIYTSSDHDWISLSVVVLLFGRIEWLHFDTASVTIRCFGSGNNIVSSPFKRL